MSLKQYTGRGVSQSEPISYTGTVWWPVFELVKVFVDMILSLTEIRNLFKKLLVNNTSNRQHVFVMVTPELLARNRQHQPRDCMWNYRLVQFSTN